MNRTNFYSLNSIFYVEDINVIIYFNFWSFYPNDAIIKGIVLFIISSEKIVSFITEEQALNASGIAYDFIFFKNTDH